MDCDQVGCQGLARRNDAIVWRAGKLIIAKSRGERWTIGEISGEMIRDAWICPEEYNS